MKAIPQKDIDQNLFAEALRKEANFVRCRGGISHRPDEFASGADMEVAVRVLAGAIRRQASGVR